MTSRHPDEPRPNVDKARAELDRVRRQRVRVDLLVAALLSEKHQNNFAANVFGSGRRKS